MNLDFEDDEELTGDGPKWYQRTWSGILTKTKDKKPTPDGLWEKCKRCKEVAPTKDWIVNQYVCPSCAYHERIGSMEYFDILFDDNQFTEINADLSSGDPLKFTDSAPYTDRIVVAQRKTGLKDAVKIGRAHV